MPPLSAIAATVERLRRSLVARRATQALVVALLTFAAVGISVTSDSFRQDRREDRATTAVVASMLADTCRAAPKADLRRQGLLAECRLAQDGRIQQAVPKSALPTSPHQSVDPDVIPDRSPSPPPPPSDASIDASVGRWFATHDLPLTTSQMRTLQRAVTRSLAAKAPRSKTKMVSMADVATAVTAALIANPPVGTPGKDGRSVVATSLDGCDVVFTYSDGASQRVGPLCGPQGRPPTAAEVSASVGDYCAAHDQCRGEKGDKGEPGYPASFTTADGQVCTDDDGDHQYACHFASTDGPQVAPSSPSVAASPPAGQP